MNKYFFILVLFFLGGLAAIQAQSKDSLFLEQLRQIAPNPKLVEGKTYLYSAWKVGTLKTQFIHANDTPEFHRSRTYVGEQLTNALTYEEFKDKPMLFNSIKKGTVKIGDENRPCYILSFTCDNKNYVAYELEKADEDPMLRYHYGLVETDFLTAINKLLVGKTIYTVTATHWKDNKERPERVLEGTCKYCPVTITRVADYSSKYIVFFKSENQEYQFPSIYLDKGKRDFTYYFTFDNPRDKYPKISQKRWEQIMNQNVVKGFTTEEVQIAFGKPDRVYTENGNEMWGFWDINGKNYVISFKNGIVDKVQTLR